MEWKGGENGRKEGYVRGDGDEKEEEETPKPKEKRNQNQKPKEKTPEKTEGKRGSLLY